MTRKLCLLIIAGVLVIISCTPVPPSQASTEAPALTEAPAETKEPFTPDYFAGFPDEYRTINLPGRIIDILNAGGQIVPLPSDPSPLQAELESIAQSFGYDLARYDMSRIVTFTSDAGYDYIAVPANPEFASSGCTGLIFDRNGAYLDDSDIYEVWFYEDKAVLRSPNGKEVDLLSSGGDYLPGPPGTGEIPLVVFVHNGCWFCGCILGKCGCLICK